MKTFLLFSCLLASASLWADTLAQANADVSTNPTITCSDSDVHFASTSCSAPAVGYAGAATASSTFADNGSGTLQGFGQALGPVYVTGQANFSDLATMTGAAGSGTFAITFTGSQSVVAGNGPTGSQNILTVYLGSDVRQTQIVPTEGQPVTVSFPVDFPFSAVLTIELIVDVAGGYGTNGYPDLRSLNETVNFPQFTAFDSNGNPIPGIAVAITPAPEPIPEPTTACFFLGGLALLGVYARAARPLRTQV